MSFLREFAYGSYVGSFPMMAVVGFITYALAILTASLAVARRRFRLVRRLPLNLHRWLGLLTILVGTFHLLLGVATYV